MDSIFKANMHPHQPDSLSPQHLLSSDFFAGYIDLGDQSNAQQRGEHPGIDLVRLDLCLRNGPYRLWISYDHFHSKFTQRVVDPTPRRTRFYYSLRRLGQSLEKPLQGTTIVEHSHLPNNLALIVDGRS